MAHGSRVVPAAARPRSVADGGGAAPPVLSPKIRVYLWYRYDRTLPLRSPLELTPPSAPVPPLCEGRWCTVLVKYESVAIRRRTPAPYPSSFLVSATSRQYTVHTACSVESE